MPTARLPGEPVTIRMVVCACIKGLCLFMVFNVLYGLINPVETGQLPTFYNTLIPGRTRFWDFNEFDPYRMVDDHAIAAARSDTFNEDIYHIGPQAHGPFARVLAAHLSDPRMAVESDGLPLVMPPDFVRPSESCALYPSVETR